MTKQFGWLQAPATSPPVTRPCTDARPQRRRWRGSFKLHLSERAFDNPDSRTAWGNHARAGPGAGIALCLPPQELPPLCGRCATTNIPPPARQDDGQQPTDTEAALLRLGTGETRWDT